MKILSQLRLRSDEKDLNPLSFVFLLISDIFIIYVLFLGLSQQIQQFPDEYDYFPYKYRSMLIEKRWVENNVILEISKDVMGKKRTTYDKDNGDVKNMHSDCREIENLLVGLSLDTAIVDNFEVYDRFLKNYSNLDNQEKQASEGKELSDQIRQLEKELESDIRISALIRTIFEYQKNDYTNAIKNYRKIFALKRVGFDFIFLLPVIVMLVLWNRTAYRKKSSLQLVISSHYVVISFIPILFEVFRLIAEVIPKILLKSVYDFLLRIKLITLWYYVVLAISVLLVVCIIWILQTKIYTKERQNLKRFESKRCIRCNTIIDYSKDYCPACGEPLQTECPECNKKTIGKIPYCMNCGNKLEL